MRPPKNAKGSKKAWEGLCFAFHVFFEFFRGSLQLIRGGCFLDIRGAQA
jgi:hypothetical protein